MKGPPTCLRTANWQAMAYHVADPGRSTIQTYFRSVNCSLRFLFDCLAYYPSQTVTDYSVYGVQGSGCKTDCIPPMSPNLYRMSQRLHHKPSSQLTWVCSLPVGNACCAQPTSP